MRTRWYHQLPFALLPVLLLLLLLPGQAAGAVVTERMYPERHRLLVCADMGNEPDEMQQMVHMIMCSNEFDIEGLIAVTGKYLQPNSRDPYRRVLHPELFHEIIDAYAEVYENLQRHAKGWHEPAKLRTMVSTGQPG